MKTKDLEKIAPKAPMWNHLKDPRSAIRDARTMIHIAESVGCHEVEEIDSKTPQVYEAMADHHQYARSTVERMVTRLNQLIRFARSNRS